MDRLHSILESAFDGVWLVDAEGRTTYANKAMAALLGSTPDEMRGRLIMEFLDQALWAQVEGFLERQRTHSGERIEIRLRRADGSDLVGLVPGSRSGRTMASTLERCWMSATSPANVATMRSGREPAARGDRALCRRDRPRLQQPHDGDPGYAELARAALPEGTGTRRHRASAREWSPGDRDHRKLLPSRVGRSQCPSMSTRLRSSTI